MDWKALARTDREYLKVFEDETNLRCVLALDASRSMQFGSTGYPKSEYARTLAATLAQFLHTQRDVVGLARFEATITDFIPARFRPGHLRRLFALLERPAEGSATDLANTISELRRLCPKRSLIVFLSDFLSDPSPWKTELAHLAAMGHDVRAIQILDPAERSLEFGKAAHWQDLETGETLYVDPDEAREAYVKAFAQRQSAIAQTFSELAIPHHVIRTDQPLDTALLAFVRDLTVPKKRTQQRRRSTT